MRVAGSHHDHVLDVGQLHSKVSAIDDDLFEESYFSEGVELIEEYPELLLLVLFGDVLLAVLLLDLVVELLDVLHN